MNFKKRLFAVAAVLAVAAAAVLISGGQNAAKAGPGATPVRIVSPLPLPTTGTATVSGTVGATQSGPWSVNVANSPAVTLAGTPTVNTNVTFPANQAVTVAAAGPLTNVGRLPSQQVILIPGIPVGCTTAWGQVNPDGSITCFDMANHAGEVLVVTDFYWAGQGPAGSNCVAFLLSGGAAWYLIKSGATVASDGFISKSEHLTTGAAVTGNPTFHGIPGGTCGIFDAQLHGYLLPNQ